MDSESKPIAMALASSHDSGSKPSLVSPISFQFVVANVALLRNHRRGDLHSMPVFSKGLLFQKGIARIKRLCHFGMTFLAD